MSVVKLLIRCIILLRLEHSALMIRPNDVYEGLIKSIYDYSHCKSITLIYASSLHSTTSLGLEMETKLMALNLYFSQKLYIQTMMIDIKKYPLQISKNIDEMTNPLFIILNDSDDIKLLLATRIFTPSVSLSSHGTWLIFFKDVTAVEKFFGNFSIPYNHEILIAMRNVNEFRKESIIEVYPFGNKFKYKLFGSWSPDTGLIPPKLSLLQRRSNLEGLPLLVALSSSTSFNPENSIYEENLVFIELMRLLAEIMNFTPILKLGRKIGYCNGSTNCFGLIDDLVKKKIDICFSPMILSSSRLKYIDMTMNIHSIELVLFVKKPEYFSSWREYLKPFDIDIWIAICILILLSGVILFIMEMIYNIDDELRPQTRLEIKTPNFLDFMFKIFSIICGQEIGRSRSIPKRTIQVTIQMTSVLLATAYSAQLIQSLTSGSIIKPLFSSVDEFLNDKTSKLSLPSWSGHLRDFPNSPVEQEKKIMKKILNEKLLTSEVEGLTQLCNSYKRGFLSHRGILNRFNLPDGCQVIAVQSILTDYYSMGLQKKSPLREIINYQIIRMKEYGFFRQIINKLKPELVKSRLKQKWIPVGWTHIYPVNIFLLIMRVFTLIILYGEIIVYDKIKQTKRSRKRARLQKSI